jgi:AcrR family transcriptional regulator
MSEPVDLRTRKRIRTKQMVQREALRLFADKGYEQTTVDDIAEAAAMSPRTFFRYFPAKEDVVLWDEYDDQPIEALVHDVERDQVFMELIRQVREMLGALYAKDPDLLLTRIKLSFTVPEIRARFINQQMTLVGPYFEHLTAAVGADQDDLALAVRLAALFAAMMVAVQRWQRNDGRDDLLQLFDDAVEALAASAGELRRTVHSASPRRSRTH